MAGTIRKNLLLRLFSGAYLLRWNDKLRPTQLTEIDKQAHKMLVACALWHLLCEEASLDHSARHALAASIIEGGIFDYFYRLVITDIKPPVFYRIKENPSEYAKLTEYVLSQLASAFLPESGSANTGLWERMCAWYRNQTEDTPAKRILTAAHLFASQWEFALIHPCNPFDDEMASIAAEFQESLDRYADLPGMRDLRTRGRALAKFANLCGQLRFQIRWTSVPRIPETAVLGHMFIVAVISYFFSLSLGASRPRCNNNFFSGLFHDLPEVLTRDIISPVKCSVPNMPNIIKKYEHDDLERRLFAPLRAEGYESLVEQLSFYLGLAVGSEFAESYRDHEGTVHVLPDFTTLQTRYNSEEDDAKDGLLIKVSDWLSAFLETHASLQTGITSPQLVEARCKLKNLLLDPSIPSCLNLDALLADFD